MVEQLRTFFATKPGIRLAYLHGSVAKGHEGPESDIDVAVLFEEPPSGSHALVDLSAELGEVLGLPGDKVDVRALNDAGLLFQEQVLRYGRCVHARSERERVDFEAAAMRAYCDFLPVMEAYDQAQRERLRRASA